MPSIVILVSAMFVASTTLRAPGGAGSKMRDCISLGSAEYTGSTMSSGTPGPSARMRSWRTSHDVSISSCPVRNTSMSPGGSVRWICITVMSAASR